MKSQCLVVIFAAAALVSQALAETVESVLQDPVRTFTAEGQKLGTVAGKDLIGRAGKLLPNGLLEVDTAGGPVFVNSAALRLNQSVSAPPCTPIQPRKVAQKYDIGTHESDEETVGTSGMTGGCR